MNPGRSMDGPPWRAVNPRADPPGAQGGADKRSANPLGHDMSPRLLPGMAVAMGGDLACRGEASEPAGAAGLIGLRSRCWGIFAVGPSRHHPTLP